MKSRLVGGKYEIKREIDEGGVARIFLATDNSNDQNVVLKIPIDNNDILSDSLINEYLFAYTHCHPSLLKPYDLIFDSGRPILVTPFIEGRTLGKYTNSLKNNTSPDNFLRIIKSIMTEILEAAGFIHFSGNCYNDFKPSNIIARENNEDDSAPSLTLIDFNLITRIGDKPKRGGTLHYLAPEVLCGYPPSIASDIYSLGVLFYQLLTGSLPYDSEIESELIADIINSERIDFEAVPPEFRSGLGCLLLHDSEKRPQNTLQAARALSVADTYTVSRKSRIDYYLKSGPPPFAAELRKRFDQFRKSTARKLFYINGYYNGTCPMNFLESEYRVEGRECFRISREINNDDISEIINNVVATAKSVRDKKIILIDDLEKLDGRHSKILYDIVKNREDIRIAAAGGRWVNSDIKREIFDPLKLWSGKRSAEEALKAFLKRDVPEIDLDSLQNQTGGDPVQIYNIVRHYFKLSGTVIEDDINNHNRFQLADTVSENRFIYQKIYASLDPDQRELIAMLSAWGKTIPLLMFVKFERKKRDLVESLINRGFLIRHRDSVSFFSGGFRNHIYDEIAPPMRKDYHKFWAIAAEEFIGDNEERLELTACHWGLSGDTERGYKYNETAAGEFYKNGDLIRARKFSETLLNYKPLDNSRRKFALKISGDIYGHMGYFNSARRMYLRVLSHHGDRETRAEIQKDLAGIYIASGEYGKSLYYINRSLEYFKNSGDSNSLSECEAVMAEVFLGIKNYSTTLERLITAARNVNGFNLKPELLQQYDSSGPADQLRNLNSILKLAQHIKNHGITIKAYTGLGQYYLNIGKNDEAVAQFNNALEISEKYKRKKDIIYSLISLGSCHYIRGDLFMAIECFQNARQLAESSGNFYLKTLAELRLTEVSLAMGNYALARDVLHLIENHDIYNEDRYLKILVDLRIAALSLALGEREKSLNLAGRISRSAAIRNRHRLAVQADLMICRSQQEQNGNDYFDRLKEVRLRADKFGFPDLASEVMLLMGEHHLNSGKHQNALPYFEDIRDSGGIPKHLKLKSAIYWAKIAAEQNRHTEAIESMIETESCAAASGFVPVAMQAAETLGELYYSRGRADLSEDCRVRANSYLEKILSALPEGYSAEKIGKQLKLIAGTLLYSAKETVIARKPAVIEID